MPSWGATLSPDNTIGRLIVNTVGPVGCSTRRQPKNGSQPRRWKRYAAWCSVPIFIAKESQLPVWRVYASLRPYLFSARQHWAMMLIPTQFHLRGDEVMSDL
jgi:hypothetical protein